MLRCENKLNNAFGIKDQTRVHLIDYPTAKRYLRSSSRWELKSKEIKTYSRNWAFFSVSSLSLYGSYYYSYQCELILLSRPVVTPTYLHFIRGCFIYRCNTIKIKRIKITLFRFKMHYAFFHYDKKIVNIIVIFTSLRSNH